MGRFKLGALDIPTFYFSDNFFVNLGPSRKIVDEICGLFSFG